MTAIILPATLELTRSVSASPDVPPPPVRMVRDKLYLERDLSRMRSELNPRQQQIFDLAIHDLNVFPVPWRSKGGTRWKFMQHLTFEPHQVGHVFSMRYYNVAMMTGRTSNNLFILDIETDSRWKQLLRDLERHGLEAAGQRSGKPGGGGHLFFHCLEGEVVNLPKNANRDDWEVRGHDNYALVAPSLHPQGTAYHWVAGNPSTIPHVSIEQVRWLGLELHSERKAKLRRRDPKIGLSNTSQDFINFGAPEHVRNITLFKTGCDMNGCGYSRQEAGEKAGQAAYLSGLGWSEINKTLDSAYKQPRTPSRQYATLHDLMPMWMLAVTFALDKEWTGRTATTDRAVFIAAALCAQAASKDGLYRASCREVAEKAHLDKSVAAAALHRLQDMGLLNRVGEDSSSSAYVYAFNWEQIHAERRDLQKPDTHLAPSWGAVHVRLLQKLLDTDLAERGSLGWPGLLLYVSMVRVKRPLTVKELVGISHLSQAQVYRGLDKLKAAGVAFQNRKAHTYRVDEVEPEILNERISVPRGVAGRSRRRREKHKLERQQRAIRFLLEDLGKYQGRTRFYKAGALPIGWRNAKQPSGSVSRWQDRGVRSNASLGQPRLL